MARVIRPVVCRVTFRLCVCLFAWSVYPCKMTGKKKASSTESSTASSSGSSSSSSSSSGSDSSSSSDSESSSSQAGSEKKAAASQKGGRKGADAAKAEPKGAPRRGAAPKAPKPAPIAKVVDSKKKSIFSPENSSDSEPGRPAAKAPPKTAPLVSTKSIEMGKFEMEVWYQSPYPEDYARLPKLYICEYCLRYMKSRTILERHVIKCVWRHPPGEEVYRKDRVSVWEVDGKKYKQYCQNLCLLAKFFLDHKTLYYDVEPFLFYVMTLVDSEGCHTVGYFSKSKRLPPSNRKRTFRGDLHRCNLKNSDDVSAPVPLMQFGLAPVVTGRHESLQNAFAGLISLFSPVCLQEKNSFLNYNVSCILTLPPYQRQGYGRLLIDFIVTGAIDLRLAAQRNAPPCGAIDPARQSGVGADLPQHSSFLRAGDRRGGRLLTSTPIDRRRLDGYLLTRVEGKIGSPEKPLSDLGLISYRSYWKDVLLNYLCARAGTTLSVKDISQEMAIHSYDIVSTLQALGMMKYWKGKHIVLKKQDVLDEWVKRRGHLLKEIDPACLRWVPPQSHVAL
ncbi:hypothetical protein HUJ04_000230 [Dendroctonus ponderosae]|nr:hypothetical protein HUJ04_000230 [Dendroctonus ponderosae]